MSVPTGTRHTEATRGAILEAAVDLFLQRRSDGFSVQEVADRAGLTHRTVYRYFSTRQELIRATAQHLAPGLSEEPFIKVSTVEEWIDAVGAHLARTEANFEVVRSVLAAVLASEDLRLFDQSLHDRDAHRWGVFRRQFPHLPESDARRTFATLRHLMSSTSYVFFRLRFGLSPAEATEAIQSGASQLVEQAARRDRAADHARRR
ncbi:MAG TPA: helix-turn-helix domain-containing protein [Actinomycetes bacterium]|jgi:AcrR family transcriptional regulator|nr:helix-turn-helix domain-containing protein [Actinomycetes bacterium]